jgi:colanic acid biosynthesis glycosyl transferase WcaI
MRILIIGINYWPELTGIAPYTTDLASYLTREGHEVQVITGVPHYPQWRVPQRYRRIAASESQRGVRITRRGHYVPSRQSALRRGLYEATFLLTGSVVRLDPRPDVILGVSPSLSGALLAAEAAIRTGRPYGLIFQDLMGRAAAQSGISGGGAVARLIGRVEGHVARGAIAVAIVSPDFRTFLEANGVPGSRIVELPNWTHIPAPFRPREQTRSRLRWSTDDTIVLHAGNMGLKQGLEQVVGAARNAYHVEPDVRFVLMGDGNQRAELERLADGLPNVTFRPFEPAATFSDVLAAADVLLLCERPTVVDMSLPSKVTSYLAAGRPIVAAVVEDGATARLLRRSGAALLVEPADPTGMLEAITALRDDPVTSARLASAAVRFAKRELSSDKGLRRASEFVSRLATGRAAEEGR